MGGIEPPSNKPLLNQSFRKPRSAHNNVEDFSTNGAYQCKTQTCSAFAAASFVRELTKAFVQSGVYIRKISDNGVHNSRKNSNIQIHITNLIDLLNS